MLICCRRVKQRRMGRVGESRRAATLISRNILFMEHQRHRAARPLQVLITPSAVFIIGYFNLWKLNVRKKKINRGPWAERSQRDRADPAVVCFKNEPFYSPFCPPATSSLHGSSTSLLQFFFLSLPVWQLQLRNFISSSFLKWLSSNVGHFYGSFFLALYFDVQMESASTVDLFSNIFYYTFLSRVMVCVTRSPVLRAFGQQFHPFCSHQYLL